MTKYRVPSCGSCGVAAVILSCVVLNSLICSTTCQTSDRGVNKSEEYDGYVSSKYAVLATVFDHQRWTEDTFDSLSKNCTEHMVAYLKALKDDRVWAAKMSDASGRYSGQFFFGNDLWLGSAKLCSEMQEEYETNGGGSVEQVPPYSIRFNVVRLQVSLGSFTPQKRVMIVGECLPASCSTGDISKFLNESLMEINKTYNKAIKNDTVEMKILGVRAVPGDYDMWSDMVFFIVGSVGVLVLVVMLIGSIYEYYLCYCSARNVRNCESDSSNSKGNLKEAGENDSESQYQNNNYTNLQGCTRYANDDNKKSADGICDRSGGALPAQGLLSQILLSFSMLSNTEKIMKTEDPAEDTISCIHGLRVLSLLWVIMVHTYLALFVVADNKTLRIITEKNFFYQTVGNASYSVDTFFFISGFLVTYLYYKSLESKRKAANECTNPEQRADKLQQYAYTNSMVMQQSSNNCEQFETVCTTKFTRRTCAREVKDNMSEFSYLLAYRVIRLTPAYLFVIGLNLVSMRYLINNTVFDPPDLDHINCADYWWRNVLYMNNFFTQIDMCMTWTWYMANDTQFYIVGVILLLISKRYFKISAGALVVIITSSWFVSGYISLAKEYRAKIEQPFEMFDELYDKPWSRIGPYLIGMMTGWYVYRVKGRVTMPFWVTVACWTFSCGIMGSLIYGMIDGYLEVWPTAFYVSIGHTAWGVAVAWVVLFCLSPQGSLLNKALGYRGMLPLSRLAYCAYLVHPLISLICSHQVDGPFHLHNGIVLVVYAGIAVMSYLLSFAISIGLEAPVVRLLKINVSRRR